MSDRKYYIYALVDPNEPEHIRYIGKTNQVNLKTRLRQHVHTAKTKNDNPKKANWIKKVLREGRYPEIIVLQETSQENWADDEQRLIAEYRKTEHRLTNILDGGEVTKPEGWKPSPEAIEQAKATKEANGYTMPYTTIPVEVNGVQYRSITEASKVTGIYHQTIKKRIVDNIPKQKTGVAAKLITLDGVEYESVKSAATILNLPINTIYGRLRRKKQNK